MTMKVALLQLVVFLFLSTTDGLPARFPKPFHGMQRLGKIWKIPISIKGEPNRSDVTGILVA